MFQPIESTVLGAETSNSELSPIHDVQNRCTLESARGEQPCLPWEAGLSFIVKLLAPANG